MSGSKRCSRKIFKIMEGFSGNKFLKPHKKFKKIKYKLNMLRPWLVKNLVIVQRVHFWKYGQ